MLNLNDLSAYTQSNYGFAVFDSSQLDWGSTYKGWTTIDGNICMQEGSLFHVRPLTQLEIDSPVGEIANLCKQIFSSFHREGYSAESVVFEIESPNAINTAIFARSNLVKIIGYI